MSPSPRRWTARSWIGWSRSRTSSISPTPCRPTEPPQRGNTAMQDVIVVIGPGQIGQAIARRVGVGRHVLLADRSEQNARTAADILANAGFDGRDADVEAR